MQTRLSFIIKVFFFFNNGWKILQLISFQLDLLSLDAKNGDCSVLWEVSDNIFMILNSIELRAQ